MKEFHLCSQKACWEKYESQNKIKNKIGFFKIRPINPRYPQDGNLTDCGIYTIHHMTIYQGITGRHPKVKGDKTSGAKYIENGLNDTPDDQDLDRKLRIMRSSIIHQIVMSPTNTRMDIVKKEIGEFYASRA